MTEKDEKDIKNDKKSHICGENYEYTEIPVKDHCPVTDKYEGSTHKE